MKEAILRKWTINDQSSLVKHANNPRIASRMTDAFPHPYTTKDAELFLARVLDQKETLLFAIDIEGEAVGGIGLHPQSDIYRKNAELGYWLSEDYWGKGIMTQIIPKMVDYGFDRLLIDRIFARPFGSNAGSQRVLEKAGFKLEARLNGVLIKNGVVEDELIYAVRRTQKKEG